jgi:Na+-transporting methylmalonyl-CoA/oxaloacetate decarboxylase gamma subunit
MKLTDKVKKRLTIAGLGVVCVVLVILIASRFVPGAPKAVTAEPSSTASDTVSPSIQPLESSKVPEVSVQPIDPTAASSQPADTGDSSGAEQTIQADPVKPSAPTATPTPQGDISDPKTTPTYKPEDTTVTEPSTPPAGASNDKGQVYVPGFGWVDDSGDNKESIGDSDGDINKPVGEMGGG